jgi:CMP-N-acetylneuraminic acid synthetase
MIYYVIPARKGSKGFPGKNRVLLPYTLNSLPNQVKDQIIITTDDEEIRPEGVNILIRDKELSHDFVSMKSVLLDVVDKYNIKQDDKIIMLYLTYPARAIEEIENCVLFYGMRNARSLLCRKKVKSNPFLCMYKNGDKGQQIINHDLYRRQDYPEVFEICHYVFISHASEIEKLNNNLYNENTVFFPIGDTVDVDTEEDFERFKKMSVHNSK